MHACCHTPSQRCRYMVLKAREDLIKEGLNERAVQKFKDTIQKVNERLEAEIRKGAGGHVFLQIVKNKDEIFIVDKLVQFSSSPTEEDAQYLRAVARTDSYIQCLIIHFMDQQCEKRFQFYPT